MKPDITRYGLTTTVSYGKKKVVYKRTLDNVRKGLFEQEMYMRVRALLREEYEVAVTIAKVYGWWMQSEILPLKWRRVDLHPKVGTLRLDPGTTKNGKGRMVYLTAELYTLLTV